MIEHEQQRLQNWRLKILQEAQGKRRVAATCRRYEQQGLSSLRDRPYGPPTVRVPPSQPSLRRSSICARTIIWAYGALACICNATTRLPLEIPLFTASSSAMVWVACRTTKLTNRIIRSGVDLQSVPW